MPSTSPAVSWSCCSRAPRAPSRRIRFLPAIPTRKASIPDASNASINCTYQTVGDLSVGWGTATLTMTPKGGGAPQTMTVRVTAGVKKINGKWLYVADHASVPMGPSPGK